MAGADCNTGGQETARALAVDRHRTGEQWSERPGKQD